MKYTLLHANTGQFLATANKLSLLWGDLDEYTASHMPVVITDKQNEIRAGNLLGMKETIDKGIITLKRQQKV